MMKNFLLALMVFGWGKTTAQPLRLAPPQTTSTRLFALPGTKISFDFRLQGAEIRYTSDGTEPNEASTIFASPLKVSTPSCIKAKSFKTGFLPSETTTVQVLPFQSKAIDSIEMITPISKKYPANGWKTLCDKQLGDANFQQNWVGCDANEFELTLHFSKKRRLSNMAVGLLRQQKSWIFLPSAIELYDKKGKLLTSIALPAEAIELPNSTEIISLKLPKQRYKSLKIKLIALPTLPDWHPGAGSSGWIFLDEIMAW